MSKRYPGGIIRKTPQTPSQTSAQGIWDMASVTQAVKENNWPIAGVPDPISKSLRFRSSASAYLNRTPASAGTSNKTFTYSAWVKRGALGSIQNLISSPNTGNSDSLRFSAADALEYIWQDTALGQVTTTQVFRDPSAWYHIMFAMDTTQATAANRFKLYINGVQVTAFATASYPAQNTVVNNTAAVATKLGQYANSSAQSFDGYMTEVYLIDGQALTPSSFGSTNDQTGVWQPIAYTGTYGTNGFYLPFSNTASTATLGYDFSGNSNNWTANNISLTSGSTYDSMVDVPTQWIPYNTAGDTGALFRGNYCTLNPIAPNATYGIGTVQAGNLDKVAGGTNNEVQGTFGVTSGKWYFEYSFTTSATRVGIATGGPGKSAIATKGVLYENSTGNKLIDGTSTAYGATFNQTNVIGVALNADTNSVTFYKDNASQGSISFTPTDVISPSIFTPNGVTLTVHFNAGQRPFAYTPPSGFKTLCTTNLTTPTIGATASTTANKYMDVTTYTGNSTAGRVITMSNMTNVGFAWVKIRSGSDDHRLANTVTGGNKHLQSNTTAAEGTGTNIIQAFSSNTFTVGSDNSVNVSGSTYVGWVWANDGTSGSTNTAGSITSTVSANTTAGFSVVTYTGNGTSGATVGHGCQVGGVPTAPSMVIVKRRNGVASWIVNHTSAGTGFLLLETGNAYSSATTYWTTAPTSSLLPTLTSNSEVNASGGTYVAYCFAPVAGYSAFGSYTGNGSSDGTFVYTGFRPKFVMFKRTNSTGEWGMWDTSRSPNNAATFRLSANGAGAELNLAATTIDILSNGVKFRTADSDINASGSTYIYMAFAESPFKYSLAR
jgi:hypothetical protein